MRLAAWSSLAWLAAGCGPGAASLSVDLQTDLVPGTDFDAVTVELREGSDGSAPTVREAVADVTASPAALAAGVRVAAFEGLAPGTYRVSVHLDGPRARRRDVLVTLSGDQAVAVAITRACDDVTCPPAEHPDRTQCARGECVAADCVEPGCIATGCAMDADCDDDGIACTVERCVERTCRSDPDDDACGPTERCDAARGCEPSACEMAETSCSDDVDDDCDGSVDCADPDCTMETCDDGDPCTYADFCGGGSCAGTPLVCEDDACVARRCDGSEACAETPITAGTPCGDDANPCTRDECDGAGACAHPPAPTGAACPADDNECTTDACDGLGRCTHPARTDGATWSGGEFARCCGGRETLINTRANCGGCGIACPGSQPCNEVVFAGFPAHPACECSTAAPACPSPQICNGFLNFCFCTEDRHCQAGQRCRRMPLPPSTNTHNYCGY